MRKEGGKANGINNVQGNWLKVGWTEHEEIILNSIKVTSIFSIYPLLWKC